MSTRRLSKKEMGLAVLTASLAASAFFYVILIEPVFREWKNLDRQLKAKKAAAVKHADLLLNNPAIEAEYRKLSSNAKASESKEEDVTAGLDDLEKISKAASVLITTLKPETTRDTEGLREIWLDVSVDADVVSLSKFLYEIEKPEHLFRVKRLTVVPAAPNNRSLKCTFLISKVFVQ